MFSKSGCIWAPKFQWKLPTEIYYCFVLLLIVSVTLILPICNDFLCGWLVLLLVFLVLLLVFLRTFTVFRQCVLSGAGQRLCIYMYCSLFSHTHAIYLVTPLHSEYPKSENFLWVENFMFWWLEQIFVIYSFAPINIFIAIDHTIDQFHGFIFSLWKMLNFVPHEISH